jgi:uncharacterized iron-regulated protein
MPLFRGKLVQLKTNVAGQSLVLIFALFAALWSASAVQAASVLDPDACKLAGRWLDPNTGKALKPRNLLSRLSKQSVVLLGESHTVKEHHLWQAQMLSGLHAYKPNLVIGFEMFPRSAQPVLDQWSKGLLSESQFLKKSGWDKVWGYGSSFYMPLFNIARQNRLPIVALNVERKLVSRVGKEGWKAVPVSEREGLSDPAQASNAYRLGLANVYRQKLKHRRPTDQQSSGSESEANLATIIESEGFGRFVDAQLTWDRAMAEALAEAKKNNPDALVVGVLGRGHIEYGYGVPHQLADLGVKDVSVLLPVEVGGVCENLESNIADAVFLVGKEEETKSPQQKPRLGVMIEKAKNGVRVLKVLDGSVAQTAKMAAGDIIVKAAGLALQDSGDLIKIIQQQTPGTWLPMRIQRGDQNLQLIAKFPMLTETSP